MRIVKGDVRRLGDVEAAARLYPHLAPFARYNIVIVPVWVGAPVAHYMGGGSPEPEPETTPENTEEPTPAT